MNPTLVLVTLLTFLNTSWADYWSDRAQVLTAELSELPGARFELSENEQKVNDILMDLKLKEYADSLSDPSKFLPSIHFFKAKQAIDQSEVFQFIRKMPKGAMLHAHSSAMLSSEGLHNLTYMDGLYGCFSNEILKLNFFFGDDVDDTCEWKSLTQWRQEDATFDDFLKSSISLVVDDPVEAYPDINVVWNKFESIFNLVSPLFRYRKFHHDYLYQLMQEFHDDNVNYLEFRTGLGKMFDEEGNIYDNKDTLQLYYETQMEFRQENIDFIGFRIIYAKSRQADNVTMAEHISNFQELQEYDADIGLLAGFDLVGQEDLGRPLSDFVDQLEEIADTTKFFFHAGETNSYGMSDLNLLDAVLLNSTRIGHGYAITKHPQILKMAQERNIAIELNPISNQVLKLVDDLRNHVGTTLIANGFPVVVACDDPGFWGAKGASYDWYMVFMGMTPMSGNLRILKQLVFNSIFYSSLDETNKLYASAIMEGYWDDFIHEILETYQ